MVSKEKGYPFPPNFREKGLYSPKRILRVIMHIDTLAMNCNSTIISKKQ